MRLIKNFLHNINDILLAILIVAIASGLIFWRMQVILDYPEKVVQEQAVSGDPSEKAAEEAVPSDVSAEETKGEAAENAEDGSKSPAEAASAEEASGEEAPSGETAAE